MKVINTLGNAMAYGKTRLQARSHRKFIAQHATELHHLPSGTRRYQAALYFADEMVNAYQIRQWYEPFKQLAGQASVVVITRFPATALALREECPLPVYYAPAIEDVERLIETQNLQAVFYVNQNIRNFQMMRFNEPWHVFICHGESEKAYMWSNQLKAYDYVFSAGQAASERLKKHLRNFDVEARTFQIGRPQIDVKYTTPFAVNESLPTLLYAPTWEGDRPSMQYGSVCSHGETLIRALINDGGFNVIFRPHPRSGLNSSKYGAMIKSIKSELNNANATSSASFLFDDSAHWGWQWAMSDICITDVSAVAYDYLATGKPLFITTPVSVSATLSDTPALTQVPSLRAGEAKEIAGIARHALANKNGQLSEVVNYYFGDVSPGASLDRFLEASLQLIHGGDSLKSNDAF